MITFEGTSGLRTGVQSNLRPGDPAPTRSQWSRFRLLAYDPVNGIETDRNGNVFFERFNFSGVVLYPRSPFADLGADASPTQRRELLRRLGKPFYVNRSSGLLVAGNRETQ
jgi:hypothetical protein